MYPDCRHNEFLRRSRDTALGKVRPSAAELRQAADALSNTLTIGALQALHLALVEPAAERWTLRGPSRIAAPQSCPACIRSESLQHYYVFAAQGVQVLGEASFCLTAGFSRMCCAAGAPQALPEPSAAGPAGPDIRLLKPQLQTQWHHAKNQHLSNIQISSGSALRVWWTCDQCPHGLPHEWLAKINHRQGMDNQCPFCTNRKLYQQKTLPPQLASDSSTICGVLLGHSQEWSDSRRGVGRQSHTRALAVPDMPSQLASTGTNESCQTQWLSQVFHEVKETNQTAELDSQ